MKANVEYTLMGQFKCDLFSGGKLVETTDFFPNFITPTGLTYPNIYAFSDCFRFLSLGNGGNTPNSGSQSLSNFGTTGLASPITGFYDSQGNIQNVQWIGWQGYANQGSPSFCGTSLSTVGPRLYRAWNIPTGTTANLSVTVNDPNLAISGLMISEFMVFPSSGGDASGQCAFSRVQKNINIPNGYNAIITYQLQVLINNTGVTPFYAGTFQTGSADISEDYEIIREWGNLSGYYKQVYCGLRFIDTNGVSYIPAYGDAMEPSSQLVPYTSFYLSPDNGQFDVNPSGGYQTNANSAYSTDGLCGLFVPQGINVNVWGAITSPPNTYYYGPQISTTVNGVPSSSNPTVGFENIRIGDSAQKMVVPSLSNYQSNAAPPGTLNYQTPVSYAGDSLSYATPGITGYLSSQPNYGQIGVPSSLTVQLPINTGINSGQNLITGRYKMITRQSVFAPVSSLGWNTRFGSLVYAFNFATYSPNGYVPTSPGSNQYYPYVDCLFYDSSGRSTMAHYRYITGIYLTQRGSGILDCTMYLSSGNNTPMFGVPYHTFQGPYNSNGLVHGLTGATDGNPLVNNPTLGLNVGNILYSKYDTNGYYCFTGQLLDGPLLINSFGFTGTTGDVYGNKTGYGWGSVYGIAVNDNFCNNLLFDLGIIDHSLQNQTITNTGNLGWPYVLPFGTPVNLNVINITYLDSMAATGIIGALPIVKDTGNFFNGSNQIISNISFVPLTYVSSVLTPTGVNGFYPIPSPNYLSVSNIQSGYFITSGFFTGNLISQRNFLSQNTGFSGFYVPASYYSNIRSGDVWNGGTYSNISTGFSVLTSLSTISGFSALQVTGLFANLSERGYMGSNPLQVGQTYNVFFTGSGTNPVPLYITNVLSASNTGPFTGYSFLSGTVNLTNFCPPTGYAEHVENVGTITNNTYAGNPITWDFESGYKLLPNFGTANYYQSDVYSVTNGGTLPALSLDNSLQIFLNIAWSAPCGGAQNCNPPLAAF